MIPFTMVKDGRVDPRVVERYVEFIRQNNPSPSEIRAQQISRCFSALKSAARK